MPQQNWRVLVFFMCSSVKMIPVLFCHFQEIHIFLLVAGEVALHFESRASEFPLSTVCIQCSLVCVSISVTFSFFFFIMCFFLGFFYNLFPQIWDFYLTFLLGLSSFEIACAKCLLYVGALEIILRFRDGCL